MAGSRKSKKKTFFLDINMEQRGFFAPSSQLQGGNQTFSFFLSAASDKNQGLIGKWSGEGKELEVFPPPDLWRQPSGRRKEREIESPSSFLPNFINNLCGRRRKEGKKGGRLPGWQERLPPGFGTGAKGILLSGSPKPGSRSSSFSFGKSH